ncbi:MAG: ABC transporter transmembrane domain-containing protein [Candidatus Hodarchaeales archaeon]|jgi:ABC-type multidrug transport system fused ATPase/permease subunit
MKIPFLKYYRIQKKYLLPYRKWIFLLAFFLVSSIGLQLINPQIIRYYIDSFQITDLSVESLNQRLIEAAILFIGIALFQQTLAVISVYISQNLAWNSTNKLREDFAEHCIKLDMAFHNEHSPGEFIERIDGDVTNLSNFFSQFAIMMLSNMVLIVGILVVLFIEDWILGLSFTIFTGVTLITLYLIWNFAMPYWKIARQKSAELFGQIEEHLTGKEDLCALGASQYTMKRFHSYSKNEYESSYKAIVVSRGIHITIMGMVAFGSTLVFVIAIPLVDANIITIGTIFMVNSYVTLLFQPIIQIIRETQNLTVADASIERLTEFFKIEKK